MAIEFTPTGVLLDDLNNCIERQNAMHITYTNKDGVSSDRIIAPLEIRSNSLYCWSLQKNGEPDNGLRLMTLVNISNHEVIDQQFNKENFN
jgi:predicted DNA-binding transcriptional regulator YafY